MSQDLCIKKPLQGTNELRGRAFCKYIVQNNHTILLVTLIIPQNVLEPCYRAVVCVLYTLQLLRKYWESVATEDALFKLNPMHCYVSLRIFCTYLIMQQSLLSVQFLPGTNTLSYAGRYGWGDAVITDNGILKIDKCP